MITSISNRIRISRNLISLVCLWLILIASLTAAMAGEKMNKENLDNPFGVLEFLHWNHSWNNYKYPSQKELEKSIKLMKEAGVGWVRMDFLWEDIEPRQGEFKFSKYDQIVDLVRKYDLQILGLLHYSTSWASQNGKWNYPPRENQFFVHYVEEVIRRYKDKVKYWEIWNEPDSSTYWVPQDGMKGYCQLLKEVYQAAKKIDPQCQILNGGLANGLASVHRLYENGAKDYFDIMNVHFFENPLNDQRRALMAVAAYPRLVRKVMDRNGDNGKKIWITEIGCPGLKSGAQTKDWWMGGNPDENTQAEWLCQIYAKLFQDGYVDKIFWAFFRDCNEHWKDGVDYFGIIRWDFSLKPSFAAYQKCFRERVKK